MQAFEKLGSFYLGRRFDLAKRKPIDELVLYDSRDLVTHAVIVGMTGSGKTGLGIGILEEAAIDGIPALVIDPKGDLTNLLLTFPELRPSDFEPWINPDDAQREGLEPAEYARKQAEVWRKGLADWGEDGDRIRRFRESAEFAIYTPGGSAGRPVAVLKSFAAPPPQLLDDSDALRDRVAGTTAGLLGLLGIEADPLQSREHILLATIFSDAWSHGRDLDMAGLIAAIQNPPVTRLGVMELETFYPAKDRFAFGMRLNNLMASPDFARWLEGEPLDIGALLHTAEAKPRLAIFTLSHLSDAERMFFVSLLLNQTLAWVRGQSGTSSLRALLYMDEITGYFPPVANPPSKLPLLMLMKQARAFGFGLVLATQNPVDLDYKGLANAGTWFIGRLQTQRDKDRVLDGLEGAAASASAAFKRAEIEKTLSQLGSRVFLMNNVHEDAPEIISTRWTLSYLRGPLTREQIRALTASSRPVAPAAAPSESGTRPEAWKSGQRLQGEAPAHSAATPVLPPGIRQSFLPVRSLPTGARTQYQPMLLGLASVYYADVKLGIDQQASAAYLVPFAAGSNAPDWEAAEPAGLDDSDLETEPAPGAAFAPLPAAAGVEKSYAAWKRDFADLLYRREKLELLSSPGAEEVSKPGESERDFRLRVGQALRERRDTDVARLREKYAARQSMLQERLRRAQQAAEVQQEQARASKVSTAVSVGAAILSAFLGRKSISAANVGRAATAARGFGRTMKESGDVGRAHETVQAVQNEIAELENQLQADINALGTEVRLEQMERVEVKPRKSAIAVKDVWLVWAPFAVHEG